MSNSDRFALPTACLVLKHGVPVSYGLPEKPVRKGVRHDFESSKTQENEAALDGMSRPPTGRRFEQAKVVNDACSSKNAASSAWDPPNRPCHVGAHTSKQNPLYTGNFGPPPEPKLPGFGRRVYQRDEVGGLKTNLGRTLVPVAQAHPTAPQSPQMQRMGSTAAVQGAHGQGVDVEEVLDDGEEGAVGDGQDMASVRDQECSHGSARGNDVLFFNTASTSAADRVQAQQDLEQWLLQEYPHGVPKRVLQQLAASGEIVSLPGLGFGNPSGRTAASLVRR